MDDEGDPRALPFHVASGGAWNGDRIRESPRVYDTKSSERRRRSSSSASSSSSSDGLEEARACARTLGWFRALSIEAPMSGFGVICKVRRGRVSVDFRRSPLSREMGTKQIRKAGKHHYYSGGSSR